MSKNSDIMNDIVCIGCGAKIQTEDVLKPGYISKEVFEKRKSSDFYCKRCFDLKHYNKNANIPFENEAYVKNFEEIRKSKGLIVYIVDIFDLDGTLINKFNTLVNSENILLVLNKVDLYLDSLNRAKMYIYLRTYFKEIGLKVRDCLMMSSFKSADIDELISKIKELKEEGQNVYFVGMTNVGKSSILNKIIYKYTNQSDLITVSNNLNTTLSNLYIPFDEESYFVDSPGLINEGSLLYYLDPNTYKQISPRSYIRPKTFQLHSNQSLFIAGFVRVDILDVKDKSASLICNFANNLVIHRCKLENADKFYDEHKDDILLCPTLNDRERLGNLKSEVLYFSKDKKEDISLFGLGFISVFMNGCIRITYFEKMKWKRREAII